MLPWLCLTDLFAAPWDVHGSRFRPAEGPEALVSGMSNQCLQAQANRLGIGRGAAGLLCLVNEPLLDVQRLFHADVYTIHIWPEALYELAFVEDNAPIELPLICDSNSEPRIPQNLPPKYCRMSFHVMRTGFPG